LGKGEGAIIIGLSILLFLFMGLSIYEAREKTAEVQRIEGICFGGTFINGECKAGSVPSLQSFQSERKPIRSSLETARMDRKASRGDGIRQPEAHRAETHSKAVQEGGVSHQGRSAYLLCEVSHGEGTGNDGNKSLQALFPQDIEDVEAARITRCRVYRIANDHQ